MHTLAKLFHERGWQLHSSREKPGHFPWAGRWSPFSHGKNQTRRNKAALSTSEASLEKLPHRKCVGLRPPAGRAGPGLGDTWPREAKGNE